MHFFTFAPTLLLSNILFRIGWFSAVLNVPLDVLVNDEGSISSEISIKDKSLFDKVRLIDELPESEKNMILQIIDLALSKKKFKDLIQQIA